MNDCILTTYAHNSAGYGVTTIDGTHHTHSRIVYARHHKLTMADLKGMEVRHICNNPPCVNPAHLLLGTSKDNSQDMVKAGRQGTGNPAKLTPEQVSEIRTEHNRRYRIYTRAELAVKYNVSAATIDAVLAKRIGYRYE